MGAFWDDRAREDAYYFVDNALGYRHPDQESHFWRGGEEALDAMLAPLAVAIAPDETILDIGCGVGRLTRVIAKRARRVVALDVSAEMLSRAQALNAELDNVSWVQGDGTSLAGVGDSSVDGCVSLVVFQHIPDPAITLGYVREMGRVLRPGGWAAFQLSNDPSIHRARGGWERRRQRLLALVGRFPKGQAHPAWLGSAVDLDELRASAADGGTETVRTAGEGRQMCFVLLRKPALA